MNLPTTLEWVTYDGTAETLPADGITVLVRRKDEDSFELSMVMEFERNFFLDDAIYKTKNWINEMYIKLGDNLFDVSIDDLADTIRLGDSWAYLPGED
jgi:hypothetical protein